MRRLIPCLVAACALAAPTASVAPGEEQTPSGFLHFFRTQLTVLDFPHAYG